MSAKVKTIPALMSRPANLSTNLAVLHMAGTPFTVLSYLWPDIDVQRGLHAVRGAPQPGSISWTNPASNHARSQSCTGCRLQCQGFSQTKASAKVTFSNCLTGRDVRECLVPPRAVPRPHVGKTASSEAFPEADRRPSEISTLK